MNHIYKVVWSKVKNCYVVVSEIAHNSGKEHSSRTSHSHRKSSQGDSTPSLWPSPSA
ncbi:ESPR domain-containing protein [Mitsuokella multacida]|uniref:ESPR domain-containing protein n=1 Tax=Mitsuokella multacida TaxID=52226 RepID=UPI003F80C29A